MTPSPEQISISVSPAVQTLDSTPGETYEGEFFISNLSGSKGVFYHVEVAPLTFENENYDLSFTDKTDLSQIVDWIEIENPEGRIGETAPTSIKYKIAVPEDAPAGGQYASFLVSGDAGALNDPSSHGFFIKNNSEIAVQIFSTVAGETREEGTVLENSLSPIYLNSPIKVSSLVKNSGNVHTPATYVVEVYPLFSNEPVFTTEDSPLKNTIIPSTTLYSEKTWDATPLLGVFRVVQTVEIAGEASREETLTLVSPLWFLILALAFLASVIFALVDRILRRKKVKKSSSNPPENPEKSLDETKP